LPSEMPDTFSSRNIAGMVSVIGARPAVVTTSSPFFKIPLEIRNEVYKLALPREVDIHVTVRLNTERHKDDFYFTTCERLDHRSTVCRKLPFFVPQMDLASVPFLDPALLHASQQIRNEAWLILCSSNTFHFVDLRIAASFAKRFSASVLHVRTLSLGEWKLRDEPLYEYEKVNYKIIAERFVGVDKLTLFCELEPVFSREVGHFEDGFLNPFRLLGRLALGQAVVKLEVDESHRDRLGSAADVIAGKAVALLLRDPGLPEEEQVPLPEAIISSIQAENRAKMKNGGQEHQVSIQAP